MLRMQSIKIQPQRYQAAPISVMADDAIMGTKKSARARSSKGCGIESGFLYVERRQAIRFLDGGLSQMDGRVERADPGGPAAHSYYAATTESSG